MKNFITFKNQNQLFNSKIMRNLFFFFVFALISTTTFAQKCKGVFCIEGRIQRVVVGPNCDQGNCIGISIPLDKLTQFMEARVTNLSGKTIASYKMTAPKNGFGNNEELLLELNKSKGYVFLEVIQKFRDGTSKKYRKKIYII